MCLSLSAAPRSHSRSLARSLCSQISMIITVLLLYYASADRPKNCVEIVLVITIDIGTRAGPPSSPMLIVSFKLTCMMRSKTEESAPQNIAPIASSIFASLDESRSTKNAYCTPQKTMPLVWNNGRVILAKDASAPGKCLYNEKRW